VRGKPEAQVLSELLVAWQPSQQAFDTRMISVS
jgi:hypothetical protein